MGFDAFLGNAKAVHAVRDLLARHRVPGSLLFAGPDGVGKKTLAVMLAKALNCQRPGPPADDFCGECGACRKADELLQTSREDLERRREVKDPQKRVEGLVYFDLQLVEPLTRYILTEQIRQLRATAYTRPFELQRRVLIVDQANIIHWQAADLLLKVLEEPPETTTLILVCPHAYELRATLRSRCHLLQFAPVERGVIEGFVGRDPKIPKSQRALAVRVIDGSISRAKTFVLADYLERRKGWLDLIEAVAYPDRPLGPREWKGLFDTTKLLTDRSGQIEETFQVGAGLFRDLVHVLFDEKDAVTNVDLLLRLKAWARALGFEGIEKLQNGIETLYRLQTRNANQQLAFDSLATELLRSASGSS